MLLIMANITEKKSSKCILITGGSGFIGTHLCRTLAHGGYKTRVLDLRSPQHPIQGVEYIKGDIRDTETLKKAMQGVGTVYHFAAMVSVPLCQEQPVESYKTNMLGTCQVLEEMRKEQIRSGESIRIVFAASATAYGHSGMKGIPLLEDADPPVPLSFYGAQKLASEHVIQLFHKTYKTPAVVFRFFNVFGPGQDPTSPYSGVMTIFAANIANNKPLSLFDGGYLTRDFVSVHDLCRAFLLALELPESKCDGLPINLGSGKTTSVRELAQIMVKQSGRKISLIDAPPREGDVLHSLADISRAKKVLGWSPQIDLEQGLKELKTHFGF